ncbi:MAG TPA: gamma-glutamyl-gamma-aminobutyrate hydrolase family protein [Candidatus Saccharimonadales bacterium]|jgi:anthranilate/para-aminobenzoate synthase component II
MKTYIVDNGSKYLPDLLSFTAAMSPEVISFSELSTNKLKATDLVILSGGHTEPVLWHDKFYAEEISIISHHTGPIIGICLGFELICHVFGSHLHFLDHRQKGMVEIKPMTENLIVGNSQKIQVYENHNWAVEKVEKPLVALASSEDGVEVIRHESRPIYAMQFHPEGKEGNGKEVFLNILEELRRLKDAR